MTQGEYVAFMQKTFKEMEELIIAKNSDYAEGNEAFKNFRSCEEDGIDILQGLKIRMDDKRQRFSAWLKRGDLKVANEGIEDVFKDTIGYAMVALGILEERKKNK
jgi:hypothetical protein